MPGFGASDNKASAYNAGDLGSIPGLGRSLGEGNGNPPQYSCLENSLDRGALQATVHWVTKESDMTEQVILSLSSVILAYSFLFVKSLSGFGIRVMVAS